MIINLTGKLRGDEVVLDLAPVYFERGQTVCVTKLFIQFSSKVDEFSGTITSTLVDKSPLNPDQQLLFFNKSKKSSTLFVTPTHLEQYKIQLPSLQSAVFNLHLTTADEREKLEIEKIYIQLLVTNARL